MKNVGLENQEAFLLYGRVFFDGVIGKQPFQTSNILEKPAEQIQQSFPAAAR